jgi:hypothetical protein
LRAASARQRFQNPDHLGQEIAIETWANSDSPPARNEDRDSLPGRSWSGRTLDDPHPVKPRDDVLGRGQSISPAGQPTALHPVGPGEGRQRHPALAPEIENLLGVGGSPIQLL